jgi:hypothetical protein
MNGRYIFFLRTIFQSFSVFSFCRFARAAGRIFACQAVDNFIGCRHLAGLVSFKGVILT